MVKGLSIMTLFFLHFENGWINPEYNFFIVRSPAFYIVVGWLWGMSTNKKTIKGHWERRKEGLVKPYIWLSIIFLCFDLLMILSHQIEPIILGRDIYKTISLRGIGTLWFLPALLGGELLFIYFRDRKTSPKICISIICLLFIIAFSKYSSLAIIENQNLNFACKSIFNVIKDISNAFIYISIAYFISNKYGKQLFYSKRIYLFLIGITFLGTAFYGLNFIDTKFETTDTLLFIFSNCCSGFGILFLFRSIEWFKPLSVPLSYCGKNSLIIMAFHMCIIFPLVQTIDKNLFGYNVYYGNRTIVYFLVALIIQFVIIEIINKKFRFIIGKK